MEFYSGTGERKSSKEVRIRTINRMTEGYKALNSHAGYRLVGSDDKDAAGLSVVRAVNASLLLGRPLLVSGEPGSGKTSLGHSISWELMKGIDPEAAWDDTQSGAILFVTKSTSQATELFYEYDALRDFRDSDDTKYGKSDRSRYIRYTGLGLAILLALPGFERERFFPEGTLIDDKKFRGPLDLDAIYGVDVARRLRSDMPSQSVVIIDEIDKAPRDFPNDILHEIDKMTFYVPEINQGAQTPDPDFRPIVVITSNSERQLPDPFLRRCAFIAIGSPQGEALAAILAARLPDKFGPKTTLVRDIMAFYEHSLSGKTCKLEKPVSISELLDFLRALNANGVDPSLNVKEDPELVRKFISLLGKKTEDQDRIRDLLKKFIKPDAR